MEFADNADGRRVPAGRGNHLEEWRCIECGKPMSWRRPSNKKTAGGRVPVVPFFSHKAGGDDADLDCLQTRDRVSEPESAAHIQTKAFFKAVFSEAVLEYRGIPGVRPDVFADPLVIEVQHSYIQMKEIARRNQVYRDRGLFVWWIFDLDVFEPERVERVMIQNGMTWWLMSFAEPLPPAGSHHWVGAFEATLARDPRVTGGQKIYYPFPAGP